MYRVYSVSKNGEKKEILHHIDRRVCENYADKFEVEPESVIYDLRTVIEEEEDEYTAEMDKMNKAVVETYGSYVPLYTNPAYGIVLYECANENAHKCYWGIVSIDLSDYSPHSIRVFLDKKSAIKAYEALVV